MGCGGQMPGWTTRLANLTKAVAKWGLSGFPTVTDAVYRQRLDTCQSCELLVNDSKCSHKACGCYVARKASLATEACPLGKWAAETENVVAPVPKAEKPKPAPKKERTPSGPKPKSDPATCSHYPEQHMAYDAKAGMVTFTVKCRRCDQPMLLDGNEVATHSVSCASSGAVSA